MTEHPLKTYRNSTRISQDALAKTVGTSRITLWRIENRKQTPSMSLIARIIKATGGKVRADDFLPPIDVSPTLRGDA